MEMSLVGTILYFIFGFGFNLYTKIFSFLADHALTYAGVNVFWAVLFGAFVVLSIIAFFAIYMYTSFFAIIVYPVIIALLGPATVLAAAYGIFLILKVMKEKRQAIQSN